MGKALRLGCGGGRRTMSQNGELGGKGGAWEGAKRTGGKLRLEKEPR